MIFLYISAAIFSLALILFLLYIFVFIRPCSKKPDNEALLCDYAHRGLHDGNTGAVPENSLAAFDLACKEGYGIELDVQLSKDGVVMVFHDYTLNRMTGIDKKLCELEASELGQLHLADTDQTIPTFAEVLTLVDGRVPILVELKGESFDTALCPRVAEMLSAYEGAYCIESFNPLLIKEMKKHLPDAYRGLLYTNVCREKGKYSFINILVTLMALNVVAKPNFISYNKKLRHNPLVWFTTKVCRCASFVWTLKGEEEYQDALSRGECPIFEDLK